MNDLPNNETRHRLLDIAEEMFTKRGYSDVKLRDIAQAIGMKHASLYYYAPGGKEQLFLEVMERSLKRHEIGLRDAITYAQPPTLRHQMYAVARWLATHPPLDLARMQQSDMRTISPEAARNLMDLAYDVLRLPIIEALHQAVTTHQIQLHDFDVAALALVSLIESVHQIPNEYIESEDHRVRIAMQLVDMMLDGWLKR